MDNTNNEETSKPVVGEIVDELFTPGCFNCYIKHLSAALAYFADSAMLNDYNLNGNPRVALPGNLETSQVLVVRAVINVTEYLTGYKSHGNLAVGLLARAEALMDSPEMILAVRGARLRLTNALASCDDADGDKVRNWLCWADLEPDGALRRWTRFPTGGHDLWAWAFAHVAEARREFQREWAAGLGRKNGLTDASAFIRDIAGEIERVRGNNLPDAGLAGFNTYVRGAADEAGHTHDNNLSPKED